MIALDDEEVQAVMTDRQTKYYNMGAAAAKLYCSESEAYRKQRGVVI